jgi:dTDP-4-dehydrorhamnose 3,5-epimerase
MVAPRFRQTDREREFAMRFSKATLEGAWLIEPMLLRDERGFFGRTFCVAEYAAHGLETHFVQHSISHSAVRGTVRGMHFQQAPYAEVKVVTCLRGAILDVIIDLRPNSPTLGQWQGFELTASNRCQVYVPRGFAHGMQSLCDDVEVGYLISNAHEPAAACGVRFDDPAFRIDWPLPPRLLSDRDLSWPNFLPARHGRDIS